MNLSRSSPATRTNESSVDKPVSRFVRIRVTYRTLGHLVDEAHEQFCAPALVLVENLPSTLPQMAPNRGCNAD